MTITVPTGRTAALLRQGVRFAAVGGAGTVLQLLLYVALTGPLGTTLAGVASWTAATVATNLAHRAFTFGVHRKESAGADQLVAFVTCLLGLALTTAVTATVPEDATTTALIALLMANAVAGIARFVILRRWMTRGAERGITRRYDAGVSIPNLPSRPAFGRTYITSDVSGFTDGSVARRANGTSDVSRFRSGRSCTAPPSVAVGQVHPRSTPDAGPSRDPRRGTAVARPADHTSVRRRRRSGASPRICGQGIRTASTAEPTSPPGDVVRHGPRRNIPAGAPGFSPISGRAPLSPARAPLCPARAPLCPARALADRALPAGSRGAEGERGPFATGAGQTVGTGTSSPTPSAAVAIR
ncbi:hypothetical protein GIS00_11415 [Nakamurella sp. YIM 132087]|uniref:GtrA/DPMS transmembrane domain-containing protein n=1 Tax=Nakamurella alba TaxID=2665158 RepID=A0A7K1FP25_9ACTN|nr:GtrA family protein [Nakamurella alba]MTD14554.1 hypothetical protein [Nakamurella alba]